MSAPGALKANAIKHKKLEDWNKDEEWTAELFASYMQAASSILGSHKLLKDKTFDNIEQREGCIRAALKGACCAAFRKWGNRRFGSFRLFAKDGPGQGRGEIWKTLAPDGVLRAIARRHEARYEKKPKRKADNNAAAQPPKRQRRASDGPDGQHAIEEESAKTNTPPLTSSVLAASRSAASLQLAPRSAEFPQPFVPLAASAPTASLSAARSASMSGQQTSQQLVQPRALASSAGFAQARKRFSATAATTQPIRPTPPTPAAVPAHQQEEAQQQAADELYREFPTLPIWIVHAALTASRGDIALARRSLRLFFVESNEAFARDLHAELNGKK